MAAVTALTTAMGIAWAAGQAHAAPQVWGACGISTSESKVVATYSKARLQCGTDNWGYRHIQQRHQTEWEALGAIENRNWRDIADLAIAKSLDAPDQSGPAGGNKTCYSGQIYLVNHVTGQIAKTIQPTIIVGGDGTILTAYPGGGCR